MHYLDIEWHLNALPPERRLEALGLRMSLERTLRDGCPRGGALRVLMHEERMGDNLGRVSALTELAELHNSNATSRAQMEPFR